MSKWDKIKNYLNLKNPGMNIKMVLKENGNMAKQELIITVITEQNKVEELQYFKMTLDEWFEAVYWYKPTSPEIRKTQKALSKERNSLW